MAHTTRPLLVAATAATAVGTVLPVATGTAAATATTEEHCVVHVLGIEESGEYLTDAPVCYPTLEEALADSGPPAGGAGTAGRSSSSVLSSVTLGTHFANSNRGGSSISISGTACDGGYTNLSAAWVNRISSTQNNCSNTRFFDGVDKSGSQEATNLATVNLGALNDASDSILYAS